jgi:sterol-4alpha-carboxylate 3-dehydrogenase (decarboxylating)
MASDSDLGVVLVVGGCGYVGYNLVNLLRSESTCSAIHVLSRNPKKNLYPEVEYHAGDITNYEQVTKVLSEVKPRVIFHTASPDYVEPDKVLWHTNVDGTRVLLNCATENPAVRAFVYTSSDSVVVPNEERVNEETGKLHTEKTATYTYCKTKAIADAEVQVANSPPKLSTIVLRVPGMYGERDPKVTGTILGMLKNKQQNMQIGNDKPLFEFCFIESACTAHILAAKALLEDPKSSERLKKGKVDGEVFLISDDASLSWFSFARKVFAFAGHPVAKKDITVVPYSLAMLFTVIGEWTYWIFTLGTKMPVARRQGILHLAGGTHWDITKAKERLGFEPVVDPDAILKKVVEAEVKRLAL